MMRSSVLVAILLVGVCCIATPSVAGQQTAAGDDQLLPLTAFSSSLLGMYRKVMEIDSDIKRFTDQYELDLDLARAVVLHESGGNGAVVTTSAKGKDLVVLNSTVENKGTVTTYQPNGKELVELSASDNGGLVYVYNKTGEFIAEMSADEYGNGVVGAWNRKGKGRTLKPGP